MQAALAAFEQPSCCVQLLRCSSQAGITRGQQALVDKAVWDPSEAFTPPSAVCQIVPALGELGRVGLALRD